MVNEDVHPEGKVVVAKPSFHGTDVGLIVVTEIALVPEVKL